LFVSHQDLQAARRRHTMGRK